MISSQPVRHLLLLGVLLVGSARSGTQAFIPVGMIRARGTSLSISKEEKDFFVAIFGKLDRKIDLVSDNLKKEIELSEGRMNHNLKKEIDTLRYELTEQIGDVDIKVVKVNEKIKLSEKRINKKIGRVSRGIQLAEKRINSKVGKVDSNVDKLHTKVDRVDKRTSILVEDKVRTAASKLMGTTSPSLTP